MMPHGWHDGSWGILWMVASWVAIIALVWVIARAIIGPGGGERQRDPKEILQERLARGEIDEAEYRSRLNVLEADRELRTPGGSRGIRRRVVGGRHGRHKPERAGAGARLGAGLDDQERRDPPARAVAYDAALELERAKVAGGPVVENGVVVGVMTCATCSRRPMYRPSTAPIGVSRGMRCAS
jgi:putative membrane protein